jgi:hypothetical protein
VLRVATLLLSTVEATLTQGTCYVTNRLATTRHRVEADTSGDTTVCESTHTSPCLRDDLYVV